MITMLGSLRKSRVVEIGITRNLIPAGGLLWKGSKYSVVALPLCPSNQWQLYFILQVLQ